MSPGSWTWKASRSWVGKTTLPDCFATVYRSRAFCSWCYSLREKKLVKLQLSKLVNAWKIFTIFKKHRQIKAWFITYSLREIGKTLKRRFSNDGPRRPQELPNAQSQDKRSRWKSFHRTSKDNETWLSRLWFWRLCHLCVQRFPTN